MFSNLFQMADTNGPRNRPLYGTEKKLFDFINVISKNA